MMKLEEQAERVPVVDRDSEMFIDLLRGVAAFMVLFGHALGSAILGAYGGDLQSVPTVWHWALSSLGFGGFWVWAFFVLSGLCIQQSVARSLERGTYTFGSYLAARVTRLYPLFLTGLGLTVVALFIYNHTSVEPQFITWKQFAGTLCMAQLITGTLPGFGASWSLTNEMTYYLLWPLGLLAARWNSSKSVVWLGALSLSVTAVLVTAWKLVYHGDPQHWLVPCWGLTAPFMIWLGGAWLGTHWGSATTSMTRGRWLSAMGALMVVYGMVTVTMFRRLPAWTLMSAGYFATPALVAVIAGSRYFGLKYTGRLRTFAAWMGSMSYPCYILHGPLLRMTESLLIPSMPAAILAQPALRFLVQIGPVFLLIATLGVGLERIFMNWRRGYLRRPVTGAAALQG